MGEDFAWYLFETTGSVEAYMLYQEMTKGSRKTVYRPRGAAGRSPSSQGVVQPRGEVPSKSSIPPSAT